MKIIVTGASGLVGTALIPYLQSLGHEVLKVIRSTEPLEINDIRWDPERGFIDYRDLDQIDVVINLSGSNIADERWSEKKKNAIYYSRINSTNFLSQVLGSLKVKPRLLINASAIGYYGDRGASILTEKSESGEGFLANVCKDWEGATEYARREGIRTVLLRFGMVLSQEGGALKSMLGPFKKGFGGRVGSGEQWWSWIAIDDLCHIVGHVIDHNEIEGPVNVVSPYPVTNKDFTLILGSLLERPTIFPFPKFLVKLVFGEMGTELMLASQRVEPDKLIKTDYHFLYPKLDQALSNLLKG